MSQWYITRYARLLDGEVELISYTVATNFTEAKLQERTNLPNAQFYKAESEVGSLLPPFKPRWAKREKYSHKPQMAKMQLEAEKAAKCIIKAADVKFHGTMHIMKSIEPMLTKTQYNLTLQALMRKPSVMKYLYERNN
jgi:hypothetical protein